MYKNVTTKLTARQKSSIQNARLFQVWEVVKALLLNPRGILTIILGKGTINQANIWIPVPGKSNAMQL